MRIAHNRQSVVEGDVSYLRRRIVLAAIVLDEQQFHGDKVCTHANACHVGGESVKPALANGMDQSANSLMVVPLVELLLNLHKTIQKSVAS
jgi:hypothetical protein